MIEEQQKTEKSNNCAGCNKQLTKLKRYYRDGKYYCAKRCWKEASKAGKEGK
ncbi:MAG: hypothetical protein Q8O13_02260 [Candidatus Omnitrophota bacterium]|nr:hypothetical protein [Candidatus Omnitrophota bacterium]